MKKILYKNILLILILILNLNLMVGCTSIESTNNLALNKTRVLDYDKVKDSLIRFHVIANSDNEADQNLKLKIKNKVIEYLYDKLNNSQSLEESREIIQSNMSAVKNIASGIVKENNYNYDVNVELGRENFPEKSYGNIVLPQGNYEAFRIIIGSGEGRNWWCVMFPPLCFVDESKAEVKYDETEEKLEKQVDNCEKNKVEIKFKIVEIIEDLIK